MKTWSELAGAIRRGGRAALVSVADVRGSTPREPGARMVVHAGGAFRGTIGGGELEWRALAEAGRLLDAPHLSGFVQRYSLGPDLGQCCGGAATVRIEAFGADDLDWIDRLAALEADGRRLETFGRVDAGGRLIRAAGSKPGGDATHEAFGEASSDLLICGAGHVGRALALTLAPLPFRVRWIDPRPGQFPASTPGNTSCEEGDPVRAVEQAPSGCLVAVMTHSHALDLAVVEAALRAPAIPYVGLIGSETKRARFVSQLAKAGFGEAELARLRCPIGGGLLADKRPAAIALCIAVELMRERERAAKASL